MRVWIGSYEEIDTPVSIQHVFTNEQAAREWIDAVAPPAYVWEIVASTRGRWRPPKWKDDPTPVWVVQTNPQGRYGSYGHWLFDSEAEAEAWVVSDSWMHGHGDYCITIMETEDTCPSLDQIKRDANPYDLA